MLWIKKVAIKNKDKQIWQEHLVNTITIKKYAILIGDVIADVNMLLDNIKNEKITIGFLDNDRSNTSKR